MRFDPSLRPGTIALVLAVIAVVGANLVLDDAATILPAWTAALVLLLVALWCANRARYRITAHPEQRRGLGWAVAVLVAAVLGLAGLGLAVWTVVRSAPAADAPLGIGDLHSVERMRWGYRRVTVIADTGWRRPAKDAGTCWEAQDPSEAAGEARRAERVEVGGDRVSCRSQHGHEVLAVFAVDRDADSPYPGVAALQAEALRRCAPVRAGLEGTVVMRLDVEHPTAEGWRDGDHDVSCVATAIRTGALLD